MPPLPRIPLRRSVSDEHLATRGNLLSIFPRPSGARRGPAPVLDLGHVVAVAGDVLLVLDQLVAESLLGISGHIAELRHPVDHVRRQMKPVEVVADDHVEGGRRRPFLLLAADMDVAVVGAAVGQPVDQHRIAVMGDDDRLVGRKQPFRRSAVRAGRPIVAPDLQGN